MDILRQCGLLVYLIYVTFQGVLANERNWNRVDRVKVKLPAPFMLSASLGVNPEKSTSGPRPFSSGKIEKIDKEDTEFSHFQGHSVMYNYQNGDMQKYVTALPIDDNSPKIKFYTMNCTMGHQCNAIIPAQTTPTPLRNSLRSDEDMRKYLKKYGLDNGFNYADDDRVNRNSVVARYFKGEEKKVKSAREGKKISTQYYDNPDYWPGSQFRPKRYDKDFQPKAKIYKFESKASRNHHDNKKGYDWDSIQSANGADNLDFQYTQELPSPSFSNPKPYPYPKEHSKDGMTSKGVWNRFSNSVVSQYDRKQNDWVKISGGNKELGSGSVTVSSTPFNRIPSKIHSSSPKGVGITVLESFPETSSNFPKDHFKSPNRPSFSNNAGSSSNRPSKPSSIHEDSSSYDRVPTSSTTYNAPISYGSPQVPSFSYNAPNNNDRPKVPSHSYNAPNIYDRPQVPSSSYNAHNSYDRPHSPSSSYNAPSSYDRPPRPISIEESSSYGLPIGQNERPFPPPSPSKKSVSFPLRVLPRKHNSPTVVFPYPYKPPNTIEFTDNPTLENTTTNTLEETDTIESTGTHTLENDTNTLEESDITEVLTTTTTTTFSPTIIIQPTTQELRYENLQDGGGGGGGGLIDNRYAVMAAVGAGLIPASLAALLPILVGRKRRRRRSILDRRSSPSNLSPAADLLSEPLVKFLLDKTRHNFDSFR